MIERRYPIQTVLAERKMFAGGGAVLPQQMMPPQQPGGILASSGPLLDAVAAGAINPDGDGGGSLSEVQGFRFGGSAITPQAIPVNLNAEDAEAADAARGAMVDFGPVPEATIPESSITAYEPEAANPGFIESIRNVLGTSGRSSVAGDGSVLKLLGDSLRSEQLMNENDQGEIIRSSIAGDGSVLKAIGDLGGDLYDYDSRLPTPSARTAYDIKRALKQGRVVADRKFTGGPGSSPDNVINPAPTNTVGEFETLPERVGLTPEEAKELNLQGMPTEDLYGFADPGTGSAEAEPGSELDSTAGDRGPGGGATEDLLEAEEADAVIFDKQVATAAEVFKKVFEDNSPDKTKSAMAKAVEEFNAAMPEYEGMSESEKGFAIMEAGLRIMAGKSSDALTNIAEGLKGLGPKFAKDAKEKRAWNRQVELSAAKYGLETVAKEKAIEQADERKLFFFYDRSKKSKTNPQGKLVTYSRADILANKGEIPEGLVEKDIVLKSIASTNSNTARLQKLITDNAKIYRIGSAEADRLEQNLEKSREAFVSGEIGITLLGLAKEKVAKGEVTGFGNAGKELLRRAFDSVGIKTGKKYTSITAARADIKRAFQSLIPITLGARESANSISNRDVEFLADAYINSGFLKNDIFSFATVNSKVLGEQLDGAIEKFRQGQKQGLASYDKVLRRIQTAEEGLSGPVALGVTVPPGPFSRAYFQSTLDEMNPYVEKTRSRLAGRKTKPMFAQKSFGAIDGYDIIDGKYAPAKVGQ